ncbi:MAG TPA: hypothetical protein VJO12_11005 [Stellaceae bacterium]|nr:hypothetical protein [Stellaceae bacterium]
MPSYVNPVELYRSAAGFSLNDDTSGERNAQNLAAGSNEPYPNIGTVPPPPDRAMSSIDRQKLQQGLTEDRTQAKQSAADLRGSGTATAAPGAPTPITRPSSASGDAASADITKHKGDPSLPGRHASANGPHRRTPAGSEPVPQESALNSPDVHALPGGDTPRPAPPPPRLPPPEKARKSAPAQAAKPAGDSATKQPAPAPQTEAAAPQPPAVMPAIPPAQPAIPPAEPTVSIPPPPPSDMLTLDKQAAVAPVPVPVPPPSTPTGAGPAATLPPAATIAPIASSPAPLGPSDTQTQPSDQIAALDSARPPEPAPAVVPLPAPTKAPEQQAALAPAPQATPRASGPDPVPQRTGRGGTVSLQAAEINFATNGLTLTEEDDRRLAGVVKLYDKHGGIVRVVGYGRRGYGADAAQQELASFSKAIERANVVARALAQLGLASNRIVVQAAPIGDGLGEDRAEVLLEF